MLKKLCFDLKILGCASKAIICLDAMKRFLCTTLIFFAFIKIILLIKSQLLSEKI